MTYITDMQKILSTANPRHISIKFRILKEEFYRYDSHFEIIQIPKK